MTISARNITLDLPIYSTSAKSLRKTLTKRSVGGSLMQRSDHIVSVRALSNVSFNATDGDRIGLIGPNGAGKTTLLKVLAGVYAPSSGQLSVQGRISSALNTTLGLDTEITGRENIFLLGYYRGIPRAQIERGLDDIIAAADLGSFIDLPVHSYSSGMMGRLTFAVATAFEPDVLLMDEWILAGDARFLTSATERTRNFVSKARIMVLASHSLEVIRAFCNKAAYLRAGQLVAWGDTEDVVRAYYADVQADVPA
jgi:ABC-type polysaccharide/polyol phosphate transport system ATPase subunit